MQLKFAYPRPQMQRSEWTPLNGAWRFCFDDDRSFTRPSDITDWPLSIVVPFPPESRASGINDRGFHRACWYQRDFQCRPNDRRVILRFGAVDYAARVWVNDCLAITHEGGHTPFWADVTDLLHASGQQTVTVHVEDDPHDLTKPRGKQVYGARLTGAGFGGACVALSESEALSGVAAQVLRDYQQDGSSGRVLVPPAGITEMSPEMKTV
ncbi:MAG: sugar-binding domain-containing protein [Burkholderiaceae bacterium]